MLVPIEDEGLPGMRVWDERVNKAERYQLMKILTPAYPAQNSTFNVSVSTLEVLKKEFRRGKEVSKLILLNKAKWQDLWIKLPFFTSYKNYLQVTISAKTEEDFKKWEGWVGSRTKILIQSIENCTGGLMLVHPGTDRYKDPEWKGGDNCHTIFFLGLFQSTLKKPSKEKTSMNLNPAVENFQMTVTSWVDRATGESNWVPGMAAQVKHIKKKDLPAFLADEINSYEKEDVWAPPKETEPAPTATNGLGENDENAKKRRGDGGDGGNCDGDGDREDSTQLSKKAKTANQRQQREGEHDDSLVPDAHDSIFGASGASAVMTTGVGGTSEPPRGLLKVSFAAALAKK